MPLLFLSHSGADTENARELKRRLEASPSSREAGLKVWFDKDDLRPGQGWQGQLEDVIRNTSAGFAVYVGSKGVVNWVDSEVRLGLSRAVGGGYPFIPILAEAAKSSALPPFAAQYQGVRDPLNDPDEMAKLLDAVLRRGGEAGTAAVVVRDPFVGLRAMTEAEADRFFGRGRDLNELVDKLRQSSLVAVDADSGSGKSSLVLAGLVPRFRGGVFRDSSGLEPDGRTWHIVVMRPGASPFGGLRTAVTTAAERLALTPVEKAQIRDLIDPARPQEIAYALQCNLPAETTETLLVIDQFEELFTQTPEEERQPFVEWLMSLVEPDAPLKFRVVLTIRNDYFNLLSAHPALFDRLRQDASRLRLKRVPDEGLAEIVNEPLKLAGHRDEAERQALITQITRDISDRPGDLALVQMALFETWNKRHEHGDHLVETYIAVGGIVGALANAAEEVRTQKLDQDERDRLESVLVRLVTLGETGGVTRRRARIAEFDEDRQALVRKLAGDKHGRLLLTTEEEVEVCHEQLLTQWPWWQNCVNRSAPEVRVLDGLITKAGDWGAANEADKSKFLATGADLEEFCDLLDQHEDWLSAVEGKYVRVSRLAERQTTRRRKVLIASLIAATLLLTVTTVASTWFLYKVIEATKEAEIQTALREQAATAAQLEAERARAAGLLSVARGLAQEDPLTASLVLSEIGPVEPPGGVATARALLERRVTKAILRGHDEDDIGRRINSVEFSPDGDAVVTAGADGTVRVWRNDTSGAAIVLRGHEGNVGSAAFSPDGRNIVSASDDGTARVWKSDGSGEAIVLFGHEDDVVAARFSSDGTRVVTASSDGTARVWNADGSGEATTLRGHDAFVYAAAFSPDDAVIATASGDDTMRVWPSDGASDPSVLDGHRLVSLPQFAFSPDSRRLATAAGHSLRIWNIDGEGPPLVLNVSERIGALAWSPDGGWIMTGGESRGSSDLGALRLWRSDGTGDGFSVQRGSKVVAAKFAPDGRHIFVAWADGIAEILDPFGSDKPVRLLSGGYGGRLAFSADGRSIVTVSPQGTMRLWGLSEHDDPVVVRHGGPNHAVSLSSDGTRFTTTLGPSNEGRVVEEISVHRLDELGAAPLILRGHEASVYVAKFSPDGERIVTGAFDDTARIWRLDSERAPVVVRGHRGPVHLVDVSANGERLLTGTRNGVIYVRPSDGGGEPVVLSGHRGAIGTARFSPDGARVVTTGEDDSTVRVWLSDGSEPPKVLNLAADRPVRSAQFDSDGARIVIAAGRAAIVWEPGAAGEPIRLVGHEDLVSSAEFSPDGLFVVTASRDRTARIWASEGGTELVFLRGHTSYVESATFSQDGAYVITASRDRTARVWEIVGTEEPVVLKADLHNDAGGGISRAYFTPDRKHAITVSLGAVYVWTLDWNELVERLKERTSLRLSAEQRARYLGTPNADAAPSGRE